MANVCAQFASGDGTRKNPYQISTLQELQEIASHPDKNFILTNNIDASETANWNSGEGFKPIGNEETGFSGHFNGQGYTISNLTIIRPNKEYNGLFGHITQGEIREINLGKTQIEGANITGGLVGKMTSGSITSSSVSGQISGRTHVAGLVGFNRGVIRQSKTEVQVNGLYYVGGLAGINRGRIIRSSSSSKITGSGHNIGGLVGNNYDGLILESKAEGIIEGENASSVGGLAGSNGGRITRSFATANVAGKSYVGGLVGNNHSGEIYSSYSTGNVEGFHLVGGLAGVNRKNGKIEEVYTTSKVSGTLETGGFIGVNRNPVIAGYWNKDAFENPEAVVTGDKSGINALNTSTITGMNSTENMPQLAFNTTWGAFPDKTPQLLWTTPYFVITNIEASASTITSGDFVFFELYLENAGQKADTNNIVLEDGTGAILDKAEDIILKPQQDTTLVLSWQTSTDDKGEFKLEFKTQHFVKFFDLKVLRLPDIVELDEPFDLQQHLNTSPTFKWEKAFLADAYQLQISENENFDPVKINISDIDTTTYTLKNTLDHYTYYHWRVRGVNEDEKGPWSEISPFITIIERPETVALKFPLDEESEALTIPTFSWAETKRAAEYTLEISPDDEFETVFFDTTVTSLDSSVTLKKELPSKQEFFWRMKALNIGGESDWSEVRSFIPLTPPTKKTNYNKLDYTLEQNYPNPFNPVTYIRYSIPRSTRVHIEVLNMLGQTVATLVDGYKSSGWHTVTFDASKLSSGFYIYRIKTEDYSYSRKLSLVK